MDEQPHERVKRLRAARGLSLQDLADASGLTKGHVWALEGSAERLESASYKRLCRLAGALGTSVSKLMNETDGEAHMKSRDFVYWLQGYFEISKADTLNAEQVTAIKNHLNLVFKHEIDPAMGSDAHQADLNATHSPGVNSHLVRC